MIHRHTHRLGNALLALLTVLAFTAPAANRHSPNVVVIFIDDMGYANIGPFGAKGYTTPNLDRMADEGRLFTDFHAATAVCSASRAGLLTGCYPERVGIHGALGPHSRVGISSNEVTLAQICKQENYATAVYGKWHLGDAVKFLPLQHGFDEYYGLPYSNDMWPYTPSYIKNPPQKWVEMKKKSYPPLPMIQDNQIVIPDVNEPEQRMLTTWYTEHAVNFIHRHKDQPFFLYVPHSMMHVPLYVSDKFAGKSKGGMLGDVIEELDWSVGRILKQIKDDGLDENTLVIFTADNGPWLIYGDHAGSTGGLREGKFTMWEGGFREPTIMRWPGHIPAGTKCDTLASTMDVLPTVAALIGAKLPDHKIDGHDIRPLLFGEPDAKSPWNPMWCYFDGELRGIRTERWKLVLPHSYPSMVHGGQPGEGGAPGQYGSGTTDLALYDLDQDVDETHDVKAGHPDIVKVLEAEAEKARADLGDSLTHRNGTGIRGPGHLEPGDKTIH
jgi:arylsulfatase A